MTKIICCSCSKRIKTTGKSLKVCRECGKPVCWACQLDGICKECGLILHQNTILKDYYDPVLPTEILPVKIERGAHNGL